MTVLDYITKFIFEALFNEKLKSFDLFDFILAIGIGLFLILLSQVFQKAKNLKDENELTVYKLFNEAPIPPQILFKCFPNITPGNKLIKAINCIILFFQSRP